MKGIMNSSAGAQALDIDVSEADSSDTMAATKPDLVVVKDTPHPFQDPLFRYVFLGFVSLFAILGVAALLSF